MQRSIHKTIILLAVAGLLAAACGSSGSGRDDVVRMPEPTVHPTTTLGPRIEYVPTYAPGPCPHDLPVPTGALGIECGHLRVPENRYDPESSDVVLTVAILPAFSPNPLPDPVIYLAGGPGGSGLASLGLWFEHPIRDQRDIILLDQRGTRFSAPTLDCPESRALVYPQLSVEIDDEEAREERLEATRRCLRRIEQTGANLSFYNTEEIAADVADLRVAMGVDQWNLLGISYGTRVALGVMRDHPEGVRSVILDSAYPTGIDDYSELAPNAQRALDTLFASCEATACAGRYPNLRARFETLVDELEADPVTETVPVEGGTEATILWDGDRIVRFLFAALYDAAAIAELPRLITDFENRDFTEASGYLANFRAEAARTFSDGMYRSVQCRERYPFADETRLQEGLEGVNPHVARAMGIEVEDDFVECETWNVIPAPPEENEPVTSDIPTLVLAGEFDPITPPRWGELVTEHLANATFVLFPGIGHGATPEACPTRIILAFLSSPGPVDTSCAAAMGPPSWG